MKVVAVNSYVFSMDSQLKIIVSSKPIASDYTRWLKGDVVWSVAGILLVRSCSDYG